MDSIKKLTVCMLAFLFIGFAKAVPPDWLAITTKLINTDYRGKGHYLLTNVPFKFELHIKNNSNYRAVLGLKKLTFTISGFIEVFNATDKKWETRSNSTYRDLPKFHNVVLHYGDRDVEIMPGKTYVQTFQISGTHLAKSDAKYYEPAWFRLNLSYRYIDFQADTREVNSLNIPRQRQSDPGHRR